MYSVLKKITFALVVGAGLLSAGTASAQYMWEIKAPFLDPRTGSGIEGGCASLIAGKIYVSHGYRFGDTPYLSAYDTFSDSWTHGGPGLPDALIPRSEMGAGTAHGKHYAIGGRTLPNADVEEFDPGTMTWTTMTPMPFPRGGVGCASDGGLIFASGGRDGSTFGSGTIFSTFMMFDPLAGPGGSWFPLPSMPLPVSDCYATVAYMGKVYVFGGATSPVTVTGAVQIYDIGTGIWSLGPPMLVPRGAAMAGVLDPGSPAARIAVFGGFDGGFNFADTDIFNPTTGTWAAPGPLMPGPASEITQGMTYDATGVYSIGSGIFGPSSPVVYKLVSVPTPALATTWGSLKERYRN